MLTKQMKDPPCYAYEGICEVSWSVDECTMEKNVFRLETANLSSLIKWKKGKLT